MDNVEKFKAKGVDFVIYVLISDPYTMNEWAEKLQGKDTLSCLCLLSLLSFFFHSLFFIDKLSI